MNGPFGNRFPYTNFHEMNLDWVIQIAKDFLDQYTQIQQTIQTGLEDLDNKAADLTQLLDEWYNTHSEDIANQLAQALDDLNTWYTQHVGYLDQELTDNINAFILAADTKAQQAIETIPADYTELSNDVLNLKSAVYRDKINTLTVPWNIGDGYANVIGLTLDPGTYTIEFNATSDKPDNYIYIKILDQDTYNNDHVMATISTLKNKNISLPFTVTNSISSIYIFAGQSVSASSGYEVTVNNFDLYKGYRYDPTKTFNVTQVITDELTETGYCKLDAGEYAINSIEMPDNSKLEGSGNLTELYYDTTVSGSALIMGSKCNIANLTLYGNGYDLSIPTTEETDLLDGITWLQENGYARTPLDSINLSPGSYTIKFNATSNKTEETNVYLKVLNRDPSYSGTAVIYSGTFEKNNDNVISFTITETAKSIWIFAGDSVSHSDGYTVTVNNSELYWDKISNRFGIAWDDSTNETGIVQNCYISRFNGAGIYCADTGTPVKANLLISDCIISNNAAGVYIRKNSEFNRISNCSIYGNYYGVLNRGGNNNIVNCSIDGNRVNVQIDANEGDNGGHGSIVGCSMNHADNNTGYSLIIRDTGRMTISDCNFYYGKTRLENTNGNVIASCGYGQQSGWEISGGACNMFANCIVRGTQSGNTPITIENNNTTKIINVFTRNGVEVTI